MGKNTKNGRYTRFMSVGRCWHRDRWFVRLDITLPDEAAIVAELRQLGCSIAVVDFGYGYRWLEFSGTPKMVIGVRDDDGILRAVMHVSNWLKRNGYELFPR